MSDSNSMTSLRELLAPYVTRVEAAMRQHVPPLAEPRAFWGQIHYPLGWANEQFEPATRPSGKRVRAAFCLMSSEAVSGSVEPALPAAAAVELLHAFSLVHDDIEDGDRLRHHRPTLWTLVGKPQAINAGDGLFALAQRALLATVEQGIPASTVLRAQVRLNEAAIALCRGQHLDMSFEEREAVSPGEYLEMIRGKTASLLSYSGEVGALMGGGDEESINAIREAGEALGLAFQMQDDLLGLWGDPERTGKPVGADIRAKKKSLPIVYALSQAGNERLRALYAGPLDSDEQIREASELIEASGAREHVSALAAEEAERASVMLGRVRAPEERLKPLRRLVSLLTARDF